MVTNHLPNGMILQVVGGFPAKWNRIELKSQTWWVNANKVDNLFTVTYRVTYIYT